MTRILRGVVRLACPPSDRRWVDALFAECDAIESRGERFAWALGAASLVVNRNSNRLVSVASPLSLLLLLGATVFTVMAVIEYEGLALEDDWYGVIAALLSVSMLAVAAHNIRQRVAEPGL